MFKKKKKFSKPSSESNNQEEAKKNEELLSNVSNNELDSTLNKISSTEEFIKNANFATFTIKNYEEISNAINHIKGDNVALIDLAKADLEVAKKVLIFVSGSIYALDGKHIKLSSRKFVVSKKPIPDAIIDKLKIEAKNAQKIE